MRVCLLTHTFPRFPGDTAAPFMDGVARGIAKAGNEVFVLTPFHSKLRTWKEKLPYKLITYKYIFPDYFHKLGYSETLSDDKWLKISSFLLAPFLFLAGTVSLYRLVKKEKIDVINAHWILPNGFMASVVSLLTRTPVVSTLPGSDVYMAQRFFLFKLLAKFATKFSSVVTSNSPQLLDDLQKVTGEAVQDKSQIIIYGVDPAKFKPDTGHSIELSKIFNIGKNTKIVLGVGRLVAKKGFEYLIRAAPKILEKNENVVFIIVGDGEQKLHLIKLAKELKVFSRFRFVGNIEYHDLPHYYNLADVFVLPSIRDEEGNLDDQSVSVIEAMSCGVPVVTTNFPGYRVVLKNGVNGFLTLGKDVQEISNAVMKILTSRKMRQMMGEANRKKVVSKLSWSQIGKKYTDLFKQIISKRISYFENIDKMGNTERRRQVGRQIVSVLKNELGSLTKLKCLDAACSSGVISHLLANEFKKVVAIDIDEPALAIAMRDNARKNLRFVKMSAEKMSFLDNTFDVVVCNQVYNFVENPERLMDEIYRVLKPGGICFFGARNKWVIIEPQYGLPFLSWFSGLLPFGKNYMDFWQLKNLVSKFKIIDYTLDIVKSPQKFGFNRLKKYSIVAKFIPSFLSPLIPNYVWILKKEN